MQSHKDFKSENLRFLIGDIRSLERLKLALKDMDIVVHALLLQHLFQLLKVQSLLKLSKANVSPCSKCN